MTIRDLAGDGDHYAATVIAESFRGKSRVQQHQIVYEALKGEMGGKLHALALQTGTPGRVRGASPDGLRIFRSHSGMIGVSGMGFAGVLRYIYCKAKGEIRRGR